MELNSIISRFENVKQTGHNSFSARCPVHDDKTNSLSISKRKDGAVLLHCHAGCGTESILSAVGLGFRDLYSESPEEAASEAKPVKEAEYSYFDPEGIEILRKVRMRRPDGSKSFFWQRLEDGQWLNGRGEISPPLYGTCSVHEGDEIIIVAEGEKDCDSVINIFGLPCVSLPDGAKKNSIRWKDDYSACFSGRSVYILQDNDDVGMAFARLEARQIKPVAEKVCIIDLSEIWPDIPPKGDVTDMIEALGPEETARRFTALCDSAEPWSEVLTPEKDHRPCFTTLAQIPEEEPTWFIEGWLPEGQICILASDGGVGKTSLAIDIAANRSAGRPCILDDPDLIIEPQRIAFISTEDSYSKKLKKKIREAGADMSNILLPLSSSGKAGDLSEFKFVNANMRQFILEARPALCILDPLQGFVPPNINMGSRNAMRDCLAPLIALGEETGTTFLIICHTNKRKGASGRERLADSSDIWDIARSVSMMGFAPEEGVRYLSHEKSNYGVYKETRLFTMDDSGMLKAAGTTTKKDKDFQRDSSESSSSSKREDCKEWILRTLKENGNNMLMNDLTEASSSEGFSFATYRRSKEELKEASEIEYYQTGSVKNKVWRVRRLPLPEQWSHQRSTNERENPQSIDITDNSSLVHVNE